MTTKEILNKYKIIAVYGFSPKEERDSHRIAKYLKKTGYEVYGINPALGGKEIEGIKCFATLAEIDFKIDIVDIFRNAAALPGIVEECNNMKIKPDVVWAQLGISNSEAQKKAEEYGFIYVENKCIYVEHKLNF